MLSRLLTGRDACSNVVKNVRPRGCLGVSAAFSTWSLDTIPQNIKDCEYAVRGQVLIRAEEMQKELQTPGHKLPFKKIVPCNIGNPQAVGQAPLRFHREVMACIAEPSLLEKNVYAEDVCQRASHYLGGVLDGRMGAYSNSKGHAVFRQDVANWLTQRDGFDTDPEDIYLTDGASSAVKLVLQMAVRGPNDGVLLPIPQYPLYSASMTLLGGRAVGYYLEEETGWSINIDELEKSVKEFKANGGTLRAIVIINPGNPTGQILSKEVMANVLKFAEREKLAILADEVYQDNVHVDDKEFVPFRKLALEMGSKVEIFSFHSVSKGVVGECGLRAGLVHCQNVDKGVMEQMYKMASISLCANVLGQALMASVVTMPPAGGASLAAFENERMRIRSALKRKAKRATERLNKIEGISCQPIEGAMYAFPRVTIKGHVMKKAIDLATPADQVYCMEMVERTGIVTVPGSGFGQKPGTFHLRLTILPDEETLEGVLDAFEKFHLEHAGGWFP